MIIKKNKNNDAPITPLGHIPAKPPLDHERKKGEKNKLTKQTKRGRAKGAEEWAEEVDDWKE